MAETKQASPDAPAASANGTGPAPAAKPCPDGECVPLTDRLMGVLMLAAAAGALLIGFDLVTGGAVARMVSARGGQGDGEG